MGIPVNISLVMMAPELVILRLSDGIVVGCQKDLFTEELHKGYRPDSPMIISPLLLCITA